jgi:hypothetical protein
MVTQSLMDELGNAELVLILLSIAINNHHIQFAES